MTNRALDPMKAARRTGRTDRRPAGPRRDPLRVRPGILAALLVAGLLLPPVVRSVPRDAGSLPRVLSIQDLRLSPSGKAVLLSLEVAGVSDEALRETVESGFPWLVTCELQLYVKRRLVPDARIGSWTLQNMVRYDNLRDEFRVTRETARGASSPRPRRPPLVVKRIDTARMLATRVSGFPITGGVGRSPATYVIRVRAEVKPLDDRGATRLARFFKQVPLFPWRHETGWYTEEFER